MGKNSNNSKHNKQDNSNTKKQDRKSFWAKVIVIFLIVTLVVTYSIAFVGSFFE